MHQPEGYVDPKHPNWMCLLKKAIYGTKQASRGWNSHFNSTLLPIGLTKCVSDPCVYVHINKEKKKVCYLVPYVDDCYCFFDDEEYFAKLVDTISATYTIKNLGELSWFLGVSREPTVAAPWDQASGGKAGSGGKGRKEYQKLKGETCIYSLE